MNTVYSMIKKDDSKLAIVNTANGQTRKLLTVDGIITSGPNISGEIATVQVKKGNVVKMYVYDLKSGNVKRIFTV